MSHDLYDEPGAESMQGFVAFAEARRDYRLIRLMDDLREPNVYSLLEIRTCNPDVS